LTKNEDVIFFLTTFFTEREGSDLTEILNCSDLVNSGYLDSLDMISLAVQIENHFGHKIDLTARETFNNMRTWLGLVELISK
jgi:acyl carrier protein